MPYILKNLTSSISPAFQLIILGLALFFMNTSCKKEQPYAVQGKVVDEFNNGLANVTIKSNGSKSTTTDENGYWQLDGLEGSVTLTPQLLGYEFEPISHYVRQPTGNLLFNAKRIAGKHETRIFNWFENQQLPNGLVPSVENGNNISLYDNALAAMVFMLNDDISRAENIFDFFNGRITTELLAGPGGFSQFRDANGTPGNHRWMGDNAWLLIALNNYKQQTGNGKYDALRGALAAWLISLQDTDGGLWAGYAATNSLLNYKVTEGNIDAYNAIEGYTAFHQDLLNFLELDRWDAADKNLMSWPDNALYRYALDCHSWSYCIFNDYPTSALTTAQRFLTTQTATVNGSVVNGYDIDEDKDNVFIEGTGQMALAFHLAGMQTERNQFLAEIDKIYTLSSSDSTAAGFPYATNIGTGYGSDPLWQGADTEIAVSAGAWYLFAYYGFNPFAVGRKTNVPIADMFWLE
jgi:hypothetical protein